MTESLVSVIIPTRNSGLTIRIVLESVVNQTFQFTEIIVVDNNSTDNTRMIAEKYKSKFYLKGPERSAQRNFGAAKASGQYLIFLDSDIELSKDVIADCILQANKGFSVITFPEIIVGQGYWAKCRALEAACYLGDDTIEAPRFYSRDVFFKLGGFDEALNGPEDWDLREKAINAGYKIGRITALTMHHEGRVYLVDRIKKKIYYAKTMRLYMKKNPRVAMRQVPFLRGCYWKNAKLFLCDPLHALGFFVLKLLETIAVIFSFF